MLLSSASFTAHSVDEAEGVKMWCVDCGRNERCLKEMQSQEEVRKLASPKSQVHRNPFLLTHRV